MKPHLQNNLDNPEVIAGLDSSNCLESIKYFPRQVKTSWYESQKLDFSFDKIVSIPEKQRIAKLKNLKEGPDFEKEVKEIIHSIDKALSK